MNKTPYSIYTIRFTDCDLFGHLNNGRYIDYLLNAREDHLKTEYGLDLTDFYKQGVSWLVAGHEISYIRPAAYNERVCIKSVLIKAEPGSLLVEMLMMDENQTQRHIASHHFASFSLWDWRSWPWCLPFCRFPCRRRPKHLADFTPESYLFSLRELTL